ncbi:hypothetical protein CK203_078334 [Vitis vinifera]|uniref:DUF4283 domain-containing protein n=1 Tax=Vitis vinifera TaxID=29760 RepID=A0A438DXZ0_VITVI|nr:hypothetical protein CK203_078334 [Vitis vinifera]
MSRGGRRQFTVESKAFELVIDVVGGKLRGCIWERCKGLSSWIRFGDASLSSLLVGVESCCRDRDDSNWSLAWEEEGRKYRLERCSNEAGRFILCSVRDLEAKRFCLIFPEGKRLSGGWNTLAEKLREVGVAPFRGVKDPLSLEVLKKEKEPDQRTYADVVNLRLGRLGDKVWLEAGRRVKPGRLEQLGRCLVGRWDKVENHPPALDYLKNWAVHAWLLKGKLDIAVMGGGLILFEFELMSEAERVLARGKRKVLGSVLMMERWHPEVGCFSNGAFASETESMAELQWARMLVKLAAGIHLPPSRLWMRWGASQSSCGGNTHLGSLRGGVLVKVGQPKEQRGVVEPPCGSSSKGVSGCPYELAERGPGKEVTDGEDSCGISSRGGGKLANLGGFKSGPAACVFGPDWEAQARSGLGEGGLKSEHLGAQMLGQIVGGWRLGLRWKLRVAKLRRTGGSLAFLGGDWRDSESLMAKARARMTEEALSAEASRYEPVIDVLGGIGSISLFFYSFWSMGDGYRGGKEQGLHVKGESGSGGRRRTRAAAGMTAAWLSLVRLWDSRQVGVEGEILKLLLRLKSRRDQGKKKGISGMTRFDREVKKLEWSINYEGESRKKGSDRRNRDRALCLK